MFDLIQDSEVIQGSRNCEAISKKGHRYHEIC